MSKFKLPCIIINGVGANYKDQHIFLNPRGASKYTGPKLSIHDFITIQPAVMWTKGVKEEL